MRSVNRQIVNNILSTELVVDQLDHLIFLFFKMFLEVVVCKDDKKGGLIDVVDLGSVLVVLDVLDPCLLHEVKVKLIEDYLLQRFWSDHVESQSFLEGSGEEMVLF